MARLPIYWPTRFIPFQGADLSEEANSYEEKEGHILCSKCEVVRQKAKIMFNEERATIPDMSDSKYPHTKRRECVSHYDLGAQLEDSALNGCHLCTHFWQEFVSPRQYERPNMGHWGLMRTLKGLEVGLSLHFSSASTDKDVWVMELSPYFYISMSGVMPDGKSEIASHYITKSIDVHTLHSRVKAIGCTASNVAKDFVNDSVRKCFREHLRCRSIGTKSDFLPTRLIDVGNPKTGRLARLVDTNDESLSGKYTALSYSWGKKHKTLLNTDTCAQFQAGFDVKLLSKTLQDAICVTRWVNVQYIWIDSMCILQDDEDDWQREAATMADVYQNSYITISALRAKDSHEGCFAVKNKLLWTSCYMFTDDFGIDMWVHPPVAICRDDGDTFNGYLKSRAWAVQELLLSPRTLHFSDRLIWECYEQTRADDWDWHIESSKSVKTFMVEKVKSTHWSTRDLDESWENIVKLYKSADLTYERDRIVAIRGVIRALETWTGLKNVAGIWVEHDISQLRWIPGKDSKSNHRAPSWSWLSIDDPIEIGRNSNPKTTSPLAKVISSSCELRRSQTEPKAMVMHGEIKILSSFYQISVPIDELNSGKRKFTEHIEIWPESTTGHIVSPDLPPHTSVSFELGRLPRAGDTLYMILLTRHWFMPVHRAYDQNVDKFFYTMLIVSPSDSVPGGYQRIGIGGYFLKKEDEGDWVEASLERRRIVKLV